jgi:hypothetical protein
MIHYATFAIWNGRTVVVIAYGDDITMVRPVGQRHIMRVPTRLLSAV